MKNRFEEPELELIRFKTWEILCGRSEDDEDPTGETGGNDPGYGGNS